MYVYLTTIGPGRTFFTVGFYKPNGDWETESDCYAEQEDAAKRVHWLNGGNLASYRGE